MANNDDMDGGFDLLSAALNESGLTDDFGEGEDTVIPNPGIFTTAALTLQSTHTLDASPVSQAASQVLLTTAQGTPVTIKTVRGLQTLGGQRRPIVLSRTVTPSGLQGTVGQVQVTAQTPGRHVQLTRAQTPVRHVQLTRAQTPVGHLQVTRAQTPVGHLQVTRAQTPLRHLQVTRAQTPVGHVQLTRAQTPVGHLQVTRAQTPLRHVQVTRAQTPVGQIQVTRSQTPVGQIQVTRAQAPVGQIQVSRAQAPGVLPTVGSPRFTILNASQPGQAMLGNSAKKVIFHTVTPQSSAAPSTGAAAGQKVIEVKEVPGGAANLGGQLLSKNSNIKVIRISTPKDKGLVSGVSTTLASTGGVKPVRIVTIKPGSSGQSAAGVLAKLIASSPSQGGVRIISTGSSSGNFVQATSAQQIFLSGQSVTSNAADSLRIQNALATSSQPVVSTSNHVAMVTTASSATSLASVLANAASSSGGKQPCVIKLVKSGSANLGPLQMTAEQLTTNAQTVGSMPSVPSQPVPNSSLLGLTPVVPSIQAQANTSQCVVTSTVIPEASTVTNSAGNFMLASSSQPSIENEDKLMVLKTCTDIKTETGIIEDHCLDIPLSVKEEKPVFTDDTTSHFLQPDIQSGPTEDLDLMDNKDFIKAEIKTEPDLDLQWPPSLDTDVKPDPYGDTKVNIEMVKDEIIHVKEEEPREELNESIDGNGGTDLFGATADDGMDFFSAFAELKETNIKAAEIEAEMQKETSKVETVKKASSRNPSPIPQLPVTSTALGRPQSRSRPGTPELSCLQLGQGTMLSLATSSVGGAKTVRVHSPLTVSGGAGEARTPITVIKRVSSASQLATSLGGGASSILRLGQGGQLLTQAGAGGAGQMVLTQAGAGDAGKLVFSQAGAGGAGQMVLTQAGAGGAGKMVLTQAGAGGTGQMVLTQAGAGGAGKMVLTPVGSATPGSARGGAFSLLQTSHLSQPRVTVGGDGVARILPPATRVRTPIVSGTPTGLGPRVVVGSTNSLQLQGGLPVDGNGLLKKELTDKDVLRLWSNDDVKLKKIASTPNIQAHSVSSYQEAAARVEMEEMEAEVEELGHAETYAEYMPAKLKIGQKHPDSVVETSSLSSVEPAAVWYNMSIPEDIIDYGYLSALQLETIVYACQKHQAFLPSGERAGFLIGDGAGVGKGRTIAGIIYENYLLGRKRSLWLSVSSDLRVDAERDLRDIGAGKIEVHALNKFKYAKISSHINNSVKKGVIFATYSSLIGESQSSAKYRTRMKQLIHWLGKDFDGLIVFDECHRAKNLCPVGSSKPTKTGLTVLQLQEKLPKARIIYASATGASEPKNMAYMTRLGLWGKGTPFSEFNDFIQAVEKRGVGAMEMVAMDMKLRGIYIARQLSFHGVSFKIEEIPIPKDFIHIYNSSVELWVEAREKFQEAARLINAEQRMRKTMWGQFWSSHQRFFKYLCISAKVKHCVRTTREAIKNGKCVVIGLQSTGEARTLEQLEDGGGELNDFVSTAKGVLQSLVEKHFPAPNRRKTMDLFGWGSNMFNESPVPSPASSTGSKRKRPGGKGPSSKKPRKNWADGSDDDSASSGDSGSDGDKPAGSSSGDEDEEEEEEEESDMAVSESSEESEADFNPFGDGSDSDEDPWLKKSKMKAKKEKKKKVAAAAEKKDKKKKDKKVKKKKKTKKPDKKSSGRADSDDELDDIDVQFDRALAAAGLKTQKDAAMSSANGGGAMMPTMDAVDRAVAMKQELLEKVERLGDMLPPNTLDQLIDMLGGPECVAEMTGRKGRVVSMEDGSVQYESRSESDTPLELLNLAEKQRFMDGEKYIAIISEAASSGISLQADRRVKNQKRRVHITLELPWSADRAVQQFGRTHRSNQVSAPEYQFLISELAGERRFASTVAKRLESLGALTHGDRRATETRDLSRFNIDNKYGRAALESVMKSVLHQEVPLAPIPEGYQGDFFADVKKSLVGVGMIAVDDRVGFAVLEKEYNSISKFLNRILGVTVTVQNMLFKYFTDTLAAVILQAKRNGRWDMGIMDLGSSGESVRTLETKVYRGNFSGTATSISLYTVSVERGLNWEQAMNIWRDHDGSEDGFYLSIQEHSGRRPALLAVAMVGQRKRDRLYQVYRPNTGSQARLESLPELKKKCRKVFPDDARYWWEDQYDSSMDICTHAYWRGSCRKMSLGLTCDVGLRCRTYHVLSGSVLSVWTKVERVLASAPGTINSRMQIIRLRTEHNKKIIGILIPSGAMDPLKAMLLESSRESSRDSSGESPVRGHDRHPSVGRAPFSGSPQLAAHLLGGAGLTRVHTPPPAPAPTPAPAATAPAPRGVSDLGQQSQSQSESPQAGQQYLSMPMFL